MMDKILPPLIIVLVCAGLGVLLCVGAMYLEAQSVHDSYMTGEREAPAGYFD